MENQSFDARVLQALEQGHIPGTGSTASLPGTMARDMAILARHGFQSEVSLPAEDSVGEVVVTAEDGQRTLLRWTRHSAALFLHPISQSSTGQRLQMPDLAVGKLLDAAARRDPRDLVDLATLDGRGFPLWSLAWAAPGKDPSSTPDGLLNAVEAFAEAVVAADGSMERPRVMDTKRAGRLVLEAVEIARFILPSLRPRDVGTLFTEGGRLVVDPDPSVAAAGAYTPLRATVRGGPVAVVPALVSQEIRSLERSEPVAKAARNDLRGALMALGKAREPQEVAAALQRLGMSLRGRGILSLTSAVDLLPHKHAQSTYRIARSQMAVARRNLNAAIESCYPAPETALKRLHQVTLDQGWEAAADRLQANPFTLGPLRGGRLLGRSHRKEALRVAAGLPELALRMSDAERVLRKACRMVEEDKKIARIRSDLPDAERILEALDYLRGIPPARPETSVAERIREALDAVRTLRPSAVRRGAPEPLQEPDAPSFH